MSPGIYSIHLLPGCSSFYLSVHPLIRSFIPLFIQAFIRSSIDHTFICRSLICLRVYLRTYLLSHLSHPSIHSSIHSVIYLSRPLPNTSHTHVPRTPLCPPPPPPPPLPLPDLGYNKTTVEHEESTRVGLPPSVQHEHEHGV